MPTVSVAYGRESTHDISLSDGSTTYGLIYDQGGIRVLQETPLTPPASPFAIEQENWIGGRGRLRYVDDPTGFFDSLYLWSTTEGNLLPSLQWRFGDGIRDHLTSLPHDNQDYAWWKLYGNDSSNQISQYLDIPITTGSSGFTTGVGYLYLRRRGTPGTLTFELCTDSGGEPDTVLQTVTKTTSDITDTVAELVTFAVGQALSSTTTYHIKVYGAGTDDATDHWEVLTNDDGSSSLYSADDVTWAAANVSMYYRITDVNTKRQWLFFELEGALYAVDKKDSGANSNLYINGVRGTATSATGTTLVDTNLSMTADQFIGAYIRIVDGTGDGQVRQITDNDATSFTVATWDITPSTDSKYVVYSTDYWTEIGTTGLGVVTGKPVVADKIAYFPQGQSDNIRRMRVNASSHDFADDSTNKADLMFVMTEDTKAQVYSANVGEASIAASDTQAWGTDLAFGTSVNIGSTDYRITNMLNHNKVLHIFKEDGIYTFSKNVVEKIGGSFDDIPDPTTGLGAATKDNQLWFGWAHSIMRMTGASVQDMMNFKLGYDGMGTEKSGYVTSITSAVGWLFAAIKGNSGNFSSILVWNGYGWHELFRSWVKNAIVRNTHWQPNIESRGRLWFDGHGDLEYIEFPQYASNPTKDSSINYHPEGVVVTPTYDARDAQLYKIFSLLRVYSEQGECEIDYQTNDDVGSSTWTVLGTANTQPVEDLIVDLGAVFKIRFRFRIQSAASRTPCILNGWQASGRMMPLEKYQWVGTYRADSTAFTERSEPDHDPSDIYSQIQTWGKQQTKLTLRTQVESSDNKVVTVSLPAKVVDWVDGSDWGGRISFAILET